MEIFKQKEITEKLSNDVLNASDGQTVEKAVGAYSSWLRILSEIEKNEKDSKLKQDIHDDELINRKEDLEIAAQEKEEERARLKEKEEAEKRFNLIQFVTDISSKAIGTAVSAAATLGMLKMVKDAIKAEQSGDPLFGLTKNAITNGARMLFQINKH